MAIQIKSLHEQLHEKDEIIRQLQRELDASKSQPSELTLNEDYRALLQILQRARAIGALEEAHNQKPTFRMNNNGNIEMLG